MSCFLQIKGETPISSPERKQPMDEKIIAIYCLRDDLLQAMHHQEDIQRRMTDAEVMTTAWVAALYWRGNLESARHFLKQTGCIPHMLSPSRYNRRLHQVKDFFIRTSI
jgi:hypothetical protein